MKTYICTNTFNNIPKDHILIPKNNEYEFEMDGGIIMKIPFSILENKEHFDEYIPNEPIVKRTTLCEETMEEVEYKWRIEMEVKCTKSKLKEVEIYLNENISSLLI
jgi:hypothetical protein